MSSHHRILGVPVNATIRQIKRAYFTKAKLLHPDVNKSPNAEKEFIRLNMAYEALTNPRYVHPPLYTSRQNKKKKSASEIKREWVKKRNDELRELARKAVLKRRQQAQESNRAFYRSFTFSIMCLISGFLFMIPAWYSYNALGEKDDSENYQAILTLTITISFISLAMIGVFIRYLILRFFN